MRKSILISVIFFSFISIQISAQTWSSLTRLTWNSGTSSKPSLAVDSSSVIHLVWQDYTYGNYDIFYKRSTDGGATWIGLNRLTWNTGWSEGPSIATDSGGGIHVVWSDRTYGNSEILYKHSSDGGVTWSGITRLTWNAGSSSKPSLATDSGSGIHVVWEDYTSGGFEIYYKRSTDNGANWSGLTRLTWNSGESWNPSITTGPGSGVHVVWADETPGNSEIFYKRSSNNGATWSGIIRLTWNTGVAMTPSITTSGKGVHVAWTDSTPAWDWEIFYKSSSDGGTNWSALTRLTWNAGVARSPSIAADSVGGIHVVWHNPKPVNTEIFYKNRPGGGSTWSGLTRLTWNAGDSKSPALAADSSSWIHVVWNDNTPGNHEIFYKNRK